MITQRSKILGLLMFSMACACTHSMAEDSSGYSVSPHLKYNGNIDGLYFLIKVDGKWTVSKNGDTKDENVEAVIVDPRKREISLYAWGTRPRGYSPETHADVWKCSPGLGAYERETGGVNICLSAFADGYFSAKVNPDKLLEASQSSGLIAMAEHDYQASVVLHSV